MRRLLSIAAFVVLIALVSASAQRGGARASGGGHSSSVGHASGGHSFSGIHSGPSISSAHSFGSFHGNRIGGSRIHTRGFRDCFGCRRSYGYPWYAAYGGYYDPYWWSDSSSSYDEDQARELALADEMNAASLEEQRLREREDRDQDLYARRAQPHEERTAPGPATALVFRDQHVEEVRNYAIAGGTLWVLNEQAAKKIPLAQLDLAATVKMNDERGVDFQVPR
jgi:hypothetical protein